MIRTLSTLLPSAAALGCLASLSLPTPALAQYFEVFTEADQDVSGSSAFLETSVVDGNTVYAFSRGLSAGVDGSIVAVTGIGGNAVATTLTTPGQWDAAADADLAGSFGAVLTTGGNLRFVNSFDNSIYEVDTVTGVVTNVVDSSVFAAFTGSGVNITAANTVLPDGSAYVYESSSDQILFVDTSGTVSSIVSDTELTALTGSDLLSTPGLEVSGNTLYFGSNVGDSLYAWDLTDDSGSVVLTTGEIEAVTDDLDGTAGIDDILAAPDGLVYFYEDDSDYILSFDPSDPMGTLDVVLSEAELNAGPGSDNVAQLQWYLGGLAWTDTGDGFYSLNVPEPATAALLSVVAVLGLSARRRP